jgi:hypothetical protein
MAAEIYMHDFGRFAVGALSEFGFLQHSGYALHILVVVTLQGRLQAAMD